NSKILIPPHVKDLMSSETPNVNGRTQSDTFFPNVNYLKNSHRSRVSYSLNSFYSQNPNSPTSSPEYPNIPDSSNSTLPFIPFSHSKGVNALALDLSKSPCLYSAGRDACVNAWDLNLQVPTFQRDDSRDFSMKAPQSLARPDMVQEPDDLQGLEPAVGSRHRISSVQSYASSIGGSAFRNSSSGLNSMRKLYSTHLSGSLSTPLSGVYDINDVHKFNKSRRNQVPTTTHRQSYHYHSDWVNDIKLCDPGYFVTASSDRAIYLWSASYSTPLIRVGYHDDHVRCLAYAAHTKSVISGGFDRRVVLWDLVQEKGDVVSFSTESGLELWKDQSPVASIYAIACNPSGSVILSGSPEKIIRGWDRRNGKQTYRLGGHTDNIRALLVSDDGKWALSGSADRTIKLWSLSSPSRCVVTYTHYDDSVWSLTSNHPDLEVFWAGGRDGLVTKISRRRVIGGANKSGVLSSDDELVDCVAVCKEDSGINSIAALDDMYLWTATGSSSIHRWRDIPFKPSTVVLPKSTNSIFSPNIVHSPTVSTTPIDSFISQPIPLQSASQHLDLEKLSKETILIHPNSIIRNIQPLSLIILGSKGNTNGSLSSTNLPLFNTDVNDALSLNSQNRFSVMSIDEAEYNDTDEDEYEVEPVWHVPDFVIPGRPGIERHVMLNNRRHVMTQDSVGTIRLWDIIRCEVVHIQIPTHRKNANNQFTEKYEDETLENMKSRRLHEKDAEIEARNLDIVEFEKSVESWNTAESIANWCTVDTKIGSLTVHIDEGRALDADLYYDIAGFDNPPRTEDQRINIGRWVLTYLFLQVICTYKKISNPEQESIPKIQSSPSLGSNSPFQKNKTTVNGTAQTTRRSSQTIPEPISSNPSSPKQSNLKSTLRKMKSSSSSPPPEQVKSAPNSPSMRTASMSREESKRTGRTQRRNTEDETTLQKHSRSRSRSLGLLSRKLLGLSIADEDEAYVEYQKLRAGKSSENIKPPTPPDTEMTYPPQNTLPYTPVRTSSARYIKSPEPTESSGEQSSQEKNSGVLSGTLSSHSYSNCGYSSPESLARQVATRNGLGVINLDETPLLEISGDVIVEVSVEETPEVAGFLDLYKGPLFGMSSWPGEVEKVARHLPGWVVQCLLEDKQPPKDHQRMSFLLAPVSGSGLAEFSAGNNRLSSSRMLRLKKLIVYIAEKLNLKPAVENLKVIETVIADTCPNEPDPTSLIKPEMWLELVCCDKPLHHKTTLASIKYHLWKSSGDLLLSYQFVPAKRLVAVTRMVLDGSPPPSTIPGGK
ncbi:hypothetical protein HK096_009781, partial [Nowakowskiella sp. JEL0078]